MAAKGSQRYIFYILGLLLLILILVVVYFKKILNKPIPGIGSILINSSYAQSPLPQPKKENVISFEELKVDNLVFEPKLTETGFKLLPTKSPPPDSCIQMSLFSTKLALILFEKKSTPESWSKYVEKCSFEFNKDISAILELKKYKPKNKGELESFLKPYKFKNLKEAFVIETYSTKRKDKLIRKEVETFININKEFKKIRNEKNIYFAIEKNRNNEIKNEFLKTVTELLYALKLENFSWAKSRVIDLIYFNKPRFINSIQDHYFKSKEDREVFSKTLIELVDLSFKKLSDKQLVEILINKLSELWQSKEFEDLKNNASANWSLTEIREKASSITYGRKFPVFWYDKLVSRTTSTELSAFLKRNIKERNIQVMPIHSYGIFKRYLPSSDEQRKLITAKLLSFEADNCYQQDLMSHLIENETLKKELEKGNKKFSRATFILKRSHHKKCLKKGIATNYHLYNLIKLGDKDENFLWWFVL